MLSLLISFLLESNSQMDKTYLKFEMVQRTYQTTAEQNVHITLNGFIYNPHRICEKCTTTITTTTATRPGEKANKTNFNLA